MVKKIATWLDGLRATKEEKQSVVSKVAMVILILALLLATIVAIYWYNKYQLLLESTL